VQDGALVFPTATTTQGQPQWLGVWDSPLTGGGNLLAKGRLELFGGGAVPTVSAGKVLTIPDGQIAIDLWGGSTGAGQWHPDVVEAVANRMFRGDTWTPPEWELGALRGEEDALTPVLPVVLCSDQYYETEEGSYARQPTVDAWDGPVSSAVATLGNSEQFILPPIGDGVDPGGGANLEYASRLALWASGATDPSATFYPNQFLVSSLFLGQHILDIEVVEVGVEE
jgi:hypothetical protein